MKHIATRRKERGHTLIELLVALGVLSLVTAGVFGHLSTATQRIYTEQVKVDNFDQARDFVDQFFRDINQIGYPNGRIVTGLSGAGDSRVAVGLVRISPTAIWFEGDINGSGVVQEVQYKINGSGTCTLCLQRSAVPKVNGAAGSTYLTTESAGTAAPDWGTEVNDLTTTTIFTYFDAGGNQLYPTAEPTGWDIYNNGTSLATVKTIHISLTIQNAAVFDPKTGQPIQTSFEGEVSLNNCSLGATLVPPLSCQ
ncbi:MAG TPA: prepilin-type N-terminal cleavage/methylation domain-containing protein [Candidatus Sulfotelmatobacter sp.]|nr:prepilin-type N-terminal cleavage/methylation domain-containing protein [Candidatus Sulfotelmatobacter sp.]